MDLLNSVLNFVAPPASMLMMAFAWPTLYFLRLLEWLFLTGENMESKVVVITGASSAIGEQIAYEYAQRKANLVLVAKREQRLHRIRDNARMLGAKIVLVMAADVVKEEDCRRFIDDTISYFGELNHLVNTASLGHNFSFEETTDTSVFPHMMDINFWGNVYPTYVALPHLKENHGRIVVNASVESWLPMPRMSLYTAAKAAVMNFYETLRFEVTDVGITVATHGLIGNDMSSGRFMLEEGAELQWKEDRENLYMGEVSHAMASNPAPEPFGGKDYKRWQARMSLWLEIFGLFSVIDAPPVPYAEEEPGRTAYNEWKKLDKLCHGRICSRLENHLFDLYYPLESANALWYALEKKYGKENAGLEKYHVGNYLAYQMKENRSIVEQAHELQHIVHELNQSGIPIHEKFAVAVIIEKLPKSYNKFARDLKHKKESITLDDLLFSLQIEERAREKDHVSMEPSSDFHAKANLVVGKKQNFKKSFSNNKSASFKPVFKKDKSKVVCYVCEKTGHFARECFQRKGKKGNASTGGQINMVTGGDSSSGRGHLMAA